MRLNNNELAEIYQNEKWMPICGHWFWNDNIGSKLFCQELGYQNGNIKQGSVKQFPLPEDGFRIGQCKANDIWPNCSGRKSSDCLSGAMAGIKIECTGSNGL